MPLLKLPNQSYRWLFAELVVVVFGILIALQVDEWRIERSQNIEEQILLNGLRAEFVVNAETIEQTDVSLSEQQESLIEFLYSSPSEFQQDQSKETLANLVNFLNRTFTNRGITLGFLNASINSGMIANISSQALQAKLLEIEDYESEITLLADDIRELTDNIILEIGMYSDTLIPYWDESAPWEIVTSEDAVSTLREMRTNQNLIPLVAAKTQRIGPYRGIQRRLTSHFQELVVLIDQELE